ncbi:MAG TPA: hypothetical protein DHN29_03360 [Cytophagales bacterium]|nr:hypothetical protein [Cytophagales bacterium]
MSSSFIYSPKFAAHNLFILIRNLVYILFLIITFNSNAQNPSYFVLGEDELADVDIYDITQDVNGNYCLATDNGIIQYDGYKFQNISPPEMVDKSVFSWQHDSDGVLYCNNLSGQVYKVSGDMVEEYFRIPDSLMHKNISFAFDDQNHLIFKSNGIYSWDEEQIEQLYKNDYMILHSDLFTEKNGDIRIINSGVNDLIIIKNGKADVSQMKINEDVFYLTYLYLNDSLYVIDRNKQSLIVKKDDSFILKPLAIPQKDQGFYRFYSAGNVLFALSPTGGVVMLDSQFQPINNEESLLEKEFISCMYQDQEGNLIMGTFKGGLYVISDLNFVDVPFELSDSKFTSMTQSDSSVFLGTQSGIVYKLSKGTHEVEKYLIGKSKRIELLRYFNSVDKLLVDAAIPFLFDEPSGTQTEMHIGAIKDVESIDEELTLLTSSDGVFMFSSVDQMNLGNTRKISEVEGHTLFRLNDFGQRTYCGVYDQLNNIVFAGTSLGLAIRTMDSVFYYEDDHISLNCSDMKVIGEKVYVSTLNKGVLVFDNGQVVSRINKSNGLLTNTVYSLQEYQGKIYLSTERGVQILNSDHTVFTSLTESEGLVSDKLIDFLLTDEALWLLSKNKLQKIGVSAIHPFEFQPKVPKLLVLQERDTISIMNKSVFASDESRFQFVVRSPSLKYQQEIQYHYQLEGVDDGWQKSSYFENKMSYVSLPPGQYLFRLKVTCRDQESEEISYAFSIKPPFYNTWWFNAVAVFGVLLISAIVFALIYLRQKRNAAIQNELNESKLSDIRSQMNPHFVFNALNSIQDYIVMNEKKLASKYLGKFADLMRIYLSHSQLRCISLQEEIDALTLYLELENLRFESLSFEVLVSKELNPQLIEIPTFIVQPIVENALKHGLLHKTGDRNLSIRFVNELGMIRCEVQDNGIGREAAREVNIIRNPSHQSFATGANRKRLELLNKLGAKKLKEEVIDLYDDQGRAIGTKVIINIPIMN